MVRTRFQEGDGSIDRARRLRREATPAEQRFWSVARGNSLGAKFRHQQRFGAYTADFFCASAKLIIELDGDSHTTVHAKSHDARRTQLMEREGYRVLRFTNSDVMANVEGVAAVVRANLSPSPSHPAAPGGALPLPQGERES